MVEVIFVVGSFSLIFLLQMLGCHGFNIGAISASLPFRTGMSTRKVHVANRAAADGLVASSRIARQRRGMVGTNRILGRLRGSIMIT